MQQLRFIRYLSLPILYIVVLILVAQFFLSKTIHYTFNSTASEEPGYYLLYPAAVKAGNIYQICLNNTKQEYINIMIKIGLHPSGNCKNGNMALLKTVVAGPGDLVQITASGVLVNHKLLPDSKGIDIYKNIKLKPLPIGLSRTLKNDEYWLYGHGRTSYDSRYFGIVNSNEIPQKAVLIKSFSSWGTTTVSSSRLVQMSKVANSESK
ncbi:MAG: putative Type secretory pathway, protease TraF [Burkholderiales bacterium]|jgi:conjugative transfer signal peptidase TraF|nr:putative Type secretory pathway, protease TraF [Burkholderiales bacterium]